MEKENSKVYELGFHLVSSLAEEQIEGEFSKIKALLEKNGAAFISEDFPKLRNLTYTMVKSGQGKNQRFDTAYFGWVKFEAEASKLEEVKEGMDLNEHILRYLIIKTVRENTIYSPQISTLQKPQEDKKDEDGVAPEDAPVAEDIDKSIDELVVS